MKQMTKEQKFYYKVGQAVCKGLGLILFFGFWIGIAIGYFMQEGGKNMEEIQKELTEIIKEQLEQCKKNKKVPSREVLDTIQVLNIISGFQQIG